MQQVFKYRGRSFILSVFSGIAILLMTISELIKENPDIFFLCLYIAILGAAVVLVITRLKPKYIYIDDASLTVDKEKYNLNEIRSIDIKEDNISIYFHKKPFISIDKKCMDSNSWKEFYTAVNQHKNTLTQTDKTKE